MKAPCLHDRATDSLARPIARFLALLDAIRDGKVEHEQAEIATDLLERANHVKSACYFFDASMVGICRLHAEHRLEEPIRNGLVSGLREELAAMRPNSYAAGVDATYADILEEMRRGRPDCGNHTHAVAILVRHARDPRPQERGTIWFRDAQIDRSALLSALTAVVIADYLRKLGYHACSHSMTETDMDLNRLSMSAGLCAVHQQKLENPFVGERFGLAAISTDFPMACDQPLATQRRASRKWRRKLLGDVKFPLTRERPFRDGNLPFERIRRVDSPTTFIDEGRVPRVPKRADFFARALFGDLGREVQESAKGGRYVMKSPIGACVRRALGALMLMQSGEARNPISNVARDPELNAANIKGASYFLSADAVGLSRAPSWVWYSHDAAGEKMDPYHESAVSMLFDQGYDTMEGASGDDWISVAQSMRAYLRFSLIGGVLAEQIRCLGYSARVHSVLDGEVLQPPLILLSGLGEVSRIGEVILNPYLGPRLKSGAVTTSMPMTHDRPIDFGLQNFCSSCNKCARECPSGAITAGPKLMYNGYEIWKSDAEKCARYRITNTAGGMCGRCMKTCPWNLEGIFSDALFRWLAINLPKSAPWLAALDDRLGRGSINPVKKWWWDIELDSAGKRYVQATAVNRRGLQRNLRISSAKQSLAAYPADLMPRPYPIRQPIDRQMGVARYRSLLSPEAYRSRLASGNTDDLVPVAIAANGVSPVLPMIVTRRDDVSGNEVRIELATADGADLPAFEAGAHIDMFVAPEFERQFSLAGDPADCSRYVIGVHRERRGRGGSELLFRTFKPGRKTFISRPRNHFKLQSSGTQFLLLAGGIGITPLLSMAHSLHARDRDFELHYSASSRQQAGFADEIARSPWKQAATMHFSENGTRACFDTIIPPFTQGRLLYMCGSDRYMDAVLAAAEAKCWPEGAVFREHFQSPEEPDRENHPFTIKVGRTGMRVDVAADQSAAEALNAAGFSVETKCSGGICGVCAARLIGGEVEHRDHVLLPEERRNQILLCCSRAAAANGVISVEPGLSAD